MRGSRLATLQCESQPGGGGQTRLLEMGDGEQAGGSGDLNGAAMRGAAGVEEIASTQSNWALVDAGMERGGRPKKFDREEDELWRSGKKSLNLGS